MLVTHFQDGLLPHPQGDLNCIAVQRIHSFFLSFNSKYVVHQISVKLVAAVIVYFVLISMKFVDFYITLRGTLQDEVTGSVLFGVQFPSISERPMLEQKANNPAFLTMRTAEGRKKPGKIARCFPGRV